MATVEAIGRVCHEANRAYCLIVGDPALPSWDELDETYRESTRIGVRNALGGATPEQSHESWTKERLAQGWRLGTPLDRAAKIHPNLVSYSELPEAQKRKDALFLAVVSVLRPEPIQIPHPPATSSSSQF